MQREWVVAIKREGEGHKNWVPNQYNFVCAKHFKPEDFKTPIQSLASVGGRSRPRRMLKEGVVPSIFEHSRRSEEQVRRSEERYQRLEKRRELQNLQDTLRRSPAAQVNDISFYMVFE